MLHSGRPAGANHQEGASNMAYVITEPCTDVKDASCVDVCPVDCIYEGEHQYFINPDECIDCAACEPVCPVAAIFSADAVPGDQAKFIQSAVDFFASK